jgi:hypothetical protein
MCGTCFHYGTSDRRSHDLTPPYDGPDGQSIEFAVDGTLQWNGEPGTWSVHGDTLHISVAARDCEGAIGFSEIYLICAGREALADRTQLVLTRRPGQCVGEGAALRSPPRSPFVRRTK